jgi:hypothetical protein
MRSPLSATLRWRTYLGAEREPPRLFKIVEPERAGAAMGVQRNGLLGFAAFVPSLRAVVERNDKQGRLCPRGGGAALTLTLWFFPIGLPLGLLGCALIATPRANV